MRLGRQNKSRARWRTFQLWSLLIGLVLLYPAITLLNANFSPASNNPTASSSVQAITDDFSESLFDIEIKKLYYEKLAQKREEALERGLLFSSKDDLVPANIKIDGQSYPCMLRLKGDLMDHLKGTKWSFRIILDDGAEWRGMNTFSIHNSQSRSHTAEWLMHNMFRDEGIIVPDYDFIKVKLNGESIGVYAYEHHFEDQLLERNKKKIGPILKHNDDAYWENVTLDLKKFPWIEASNIELFNKEALDKDYFKAAYEDGYSFLNAFLEESATASEVFDTDIMARYYALMDLTHAWHAQSFTNIRFYVNPYTGKLEPIGFDCFGDYLHIVTKDWDAFGEGVNSKASKEAMYKRGNVYRYLLFKSDDFFKKYLQYLQEYTTHDYVKNIRAKYKIGLDNRITFIKSDPDYEKFEDNWDQMFMKSNFINQKIQPRPNLSLKALRINDSKSNIEIIGYHNFPLEVHGFGDEYKMTDTLAHPLLIEAFNVKLPPIKTTYTHHKDIDYLYYSTLGLEEIHKTQLKKVNAPRVITKTPKTTGIDYSQWPFITVRKKTIAISPGNHLIDSPLIIPKDHTLEIAANANIKFQSNGCIISYGKINALGSRQEPIVFYSEGKQKKGGILISEAEQKSTFHHCKFLALAGIENRGIYSSAALGIYESEADLRHCTFHEIEARQAIDLHEAMLLVRRCQITSCQGKGIHSHYSSLSLIDFKMTNLGNHGIHMISGFLTGENIDVIESLQTGLSITDNARVHLQSLGVNNSYQGLYVNKHANVKIENLWLKELERGIECRGAEDPATQLSIGKIHKKNIRNLYLLKQGVTIEVDGKTEAGS